MELRRSSRLNSSSNSNTPAITSSPVLNRSRTSRISPKKSPTPANSSQSSNRLTESFSEDDSNPNLSEDDSSCDSECEQEFLRNRRPVTSSPGKLTQSSSPPKSTNISIKQEPNSSTFSTCLGIVSILVIAVALIGCLILTMFPFGPVAQESQRHALKSSKEMFEDKLLREVKSLQSSYPHQPMKTWIEFMAAVTSITGNPSQPAVLLLAATNATAAIETSKCIAKQLARVTNRLFNVPSSPAFQISTPRSGTDHRIKEELDDKIHAILSKSYAMLLDDINHIPPRAAMVLHGYCDNFMAPFKQRVIILTVVVNEDLTSDGVDDFLRDLWDPELGEDKAASLVSRVANMPVFIHPEESLTACG